MEPKQILFKEKARVKIVDGVNKLAEAVVTTLGPRGRNVAIERSWGDPIILHDGVSVAKQVILEDPFENMGAQLVRQAAAKTNDQAGDGTTTATLLTQELVNRGMKEIEKGRNPMFMKKGIDRAVKIVVKELKGIAQEVKEENWERIATISAQNEVIGKKISEALKSVGDNGLVEVDNGGNNEITIEHTEGMEFDRGYISPYFATDGNTMEAVLEDVFILITNSRLSSPQPLLPLLEKVMNSGKPILMIVDNMDGSALKSVVLNKMKGIMSVCVVRTPAFGNNSDSVLEDIAILTGGTVISSETGKKLEEVELEDLGMAQRVIVNRDTTKIVGGKGDTSEVKVRVKSLKKLVKNTSSEFDQTKINERIAKLSKGVAIVRVGASTEVEMEDLKERVKDAIGATKAAVEEGIVPGGGLALFKISTLLEDIVEKNKDIQAGIKIVRESIRAPLIRLIENSGEDGGVISAKISKQDNKNYGFDVSSLKYGDMFDLKIFDPVKVTRLALENSASIASMILTTEALIVNKPKENTEPK